MSRRWSHHHIHEGKRYERHFWTLWKSNNNPKDPTDEKELGGISVEYQLFRKGPSITASFTADPWNIKLHLGLGRLGQVFIGFERWRPVLWFAKHVLPKNPKHGYPEEREIDISLHDRLICWSIWREPGVSRRGDRLNVVWSWDRWLFGSPELAKSVLDFGTTVVPMPEGPYDAKWQVEEWTRTWPRFRRPKTSKHGEISVDGGIYVPGKGENSWDCGDDAIFSVGCNEGTEQALVAKYVESVYRSRLNYGGTVVKP
jgi:hypothetical protein